MTAFGRGVVSVLKAERLQSAVLIGHSMGGGVIVEAAHELPEVVIGIVGADTFKTLRASARTEIQKKEVGIGAMAVIKAAGPGFDRVQALPIPKFAINSDFRAVDQAALKDAGVDVILMSGGMALGPNCSGGSSRPSRRREPNTVQPTPSGVKAAR